MIPLWLDISAQGRLGGYYLDFITGKECVTKSMNMCGHV
jgi:hypothetical protein